MWHGMLASVLTTAVLAALFHGAGDELSFWLLQSCTTGLYHLAYQCLSKGASSHVNASYRRIQEALGPGSTEKMVPVWGIRTLALSAYIIALP